MVAAPDVPENGENGLSILAKDKERLTKHWNSSVSKLQYKIGIPIHDEGTGE